MDLVEDGVLVSRKSASNSEASDLIHREAKQVCAAIMRLGHSKTYVTWQESIPSTYLTTCRPLVQLHRPRFQEPQSCINMMDATRAGFWPESALGAGGPGDYHTALPPCGRVPLGRGPAFRVLPVKCRSLGPQHPGAVSSSASGPLLQVPWPCQPP
jgi:hypothetical protein